MNTSIFTRSTKQIVTDSDKKANLATQKLPKLQLVFLQKKRISSPTIFGVWKIQMSLNAISNWKNDDFSTK